LLKVGDHPVELLEDRSLLLLHDLDACGQRRARRGAYRNRDTA
jgi:hypothetical protein